MNTEPRLYYVTGCDDYGHKRTVKTYAHNPAEARWNARPILATSGTVRRGTR